MPTITTGADTWTSSAFPNSQHGSDRRLTIRFGYQARIWVWMAVPPLTNRTISSATLRARVAGAFPAQTITVSVPSARWAADTLTHTTSTTSATVVKSVAVPATADGGVIEWDVTTWAQQLAGGAPNFGFVLTTNSQVDSYLRSFDFGGPSWELEFAASEAPMRPSRLVPDGGAISRAQPWLTTDFVDSLGSTSIGAIRAQIYSAASGGNPIWDSGPVPTSEPMLNLARTDIPIPGGANLFTNAGFANSNGWSPYGTSTSLSVETVDGLQALRVQKDATAANIGTHTAWITPQPLPGERITVSAQIKVPAGSPITSVQMLLRDDPNNDSSASNATSTDLTFAVTPGVWTTISFSTTMKSDRTLTRVYFIAAGTLATGTYMHLRSPSLTRASTPFLGFAPDRWYYWQVQVRDDSGLWSAWSPRASVYRSPKALLTWSSPAPVSGTALIGDATLTVAARVDKLITGWQLLVKDPPERGGRIRWNSGIMQIPDGTAVPPAGLELSREIPAIDPASKIRVLIDDYDYIFDIRTWDEPAGIARVNAPSDVVFASNEIRVRFNDDIATEPPVLLSVVDVDGQPLRQDLTWSRSASADKWQIYRNGSIVATLLPADVVTAGGQYKWRTDGEATAPYWRYNWTIRAVVNGKMSRPSNTIVAQAQPEGTWLITEDGDAVCISGTEDSHDDWQQVDRRTTLKPIGSGRDVDIITGLEGMSGGVEGYISDDDGVTGQSYDAAIAVLTRIRRNPDRPVRLVSGSFAKPVIIRDLSWPPDGELFLPGGRRVNVTFTFSQDGEFDAAI